MIQITLAQIQAAVAIAPGGVKVLTFVDPQSGIQVVIPMDPLFAQQLATQLRGGLSVVEKPTNGRTEEQN